MARGKISLHLTINIFFGKESANKIENQYDFYIIYPPNNRFCSLEILSEMVNISNLVKSVT